MFAVLFSCLNYYKNDDLAIIFIYLHVYIAFVVSFIYSVLSYLYCILPETMEDALITIVELRGQLDRSNVVAVDRPFNE